MDYLAIAHNMHYRFIKTRKYLNFARSLLANYCCGAPTFVRMLPTDRCNLDCAYCWQRNSATTEMTFDDFVLFLNKAVLLRTGLISFLGGEPMIWRSLYDAIALCTRRGILTDMTTNGTLLTPKTVSRLGLAGLDHLNISVDGAKASKATRKTAVFRPGLVDALISARKTWGMHVRINSVIYRNNFADIREIMNLSATYGIPLSLGIVVPPLISTGKQQIDDDIHFMSSDLPLVESMVEEILHRKRHGVPIFDPDAYFTQIPRFLRGEKFWDCNYPTRFGWINVTANGMIRGCTKKMNDLPFHFLDMDRRQLDLLRQELRQSVRSCNAFCYSNCAYDAFFFVHNKVKFFGTIGMN